MLKLNNIYQGDCLELMKEIDDGSVDMVLTDPPYSVGGGLGKNEKRYKNIAEAESWDNKIPPSQLFNVLNHVIRVNGIVAIFSQEPYTSELILGTEHNITFCYKYTWLKDHFANSLLVNKAPVSYTEDICIFKKKHDVENIHPLRNYSKKVFDYIGLKLKDINKTLGHRKAEHFFYFNTTQFALCSEDIYRQLINIFRIDKMDGFCNYDYLLRKNDKYETTFNLPNGQKYKSNVLQYPKEYKKQLHPTQKPVDLLKDLVLTYTNRNDTVLDPFIGSGTTAVACKKLNRNFIGIELDGNYCEIARKRIEQTEVEEESDENRGKDITEL